MKFVLTVLFALLNVARAADEIKSFELTSREGGTIGFTAGVAKSDVPVVLTFTVKDVSVVAAPVIVFTENRSVDTSTAAKAENFSWNGFTLGVTYRVGVVSSTAPGDDDDDNHPPFPDFTLTSFALTLVKSAHTGPDASFTVKLNPGGQNVDLTLDFIDLKTGEKLTQFQQRYDRVEASSEVEEQAFTVTGLPGGTTYAVRVEAKQFGTVKKDFATTEVVVPIYSKIVLLDPKPFPKTEDNESAGAELSAKITGSGAEIDTVTFHYGPAKDDYPNFVVGVADDVKNPDGSTTYRATVPEDPVLLRRGVTYHYEVRVTNKDSGGESVSADGTFTTPPNAAPIAVADTVRLLGDSPILIDVTKNDRDPNGDDYKEIISVTQGKQGRVVIEGDKVRYIPIHDASGSDTFTYTIRDDFVDEVTSADDRKSATGTVTILAPGLTSRGLHVAELKDEEGNVVGLVRLLGTGGGGVSGKVQLYSKTYTVQGEIGPNGHFYFTIPQGDNPPLQLDVDYEPEGESPGAFDVSLASFEKSFSGMAIPNTLSDARRDEIVGKYTIEIPGGSGDGEPAGVGYAQVEVRPWGEVSLKGRLADGTKFSTKGVLAGSDSTPSVSLWFTPEESRIGLTFTFSEGADPTISGQSRWYRGQDRSAEFFPDGFYLEPTITGSRFTPSEKNRSLDGGSKSTLTLRDGNISTDIVQQVEISKSDRVNFLNSNPYGVTLKINRENGTFKGEFDHPFDDSRRKFNGVIIQSQDKGSGMFIGIDQTGSVALTVGITNPPPPTPPPTTPNNPNNPNNGGTGGDGGGLDINFGF